MKIPKARKEHKVFLEIRFRYCTHSSHFLVINLTIQFFYCFTECFKLFIVILVKRYNVLTIITLNSFEANATNLNINNRHRCTCISAVRTIRIMYHTQ